LQASMLALRSNIAARSSSAMRAAAPTPRAAGRASRVARRTKVTAMTLLRMKRLGEKICMVTCHDYPSATHAKAAGVDVALCGDSLGMVALGYETTVPVTLDEMLHHCRAARRGLGDDGPSRDRAVTKPARCVFFVRRVE